jgi:citrate lyase subunit beta / citryl-CoA lyase
VAAAAQAGIDCIDGPWLDADDLDGLAAELKRLAAMGFSGKCSYDAAQIPIIHAAFTPSAAQIEHAQRLIAAVEASPTGSARVDGRAANKANAKAARRLLDLAARRGVM